MKEERFEGVVVWFKSNPGYGFVEWFKGSVKQKDLFVHFSDIVADEGKFRNLKKDQKVSFGLGLNNKSQPKAVEVKSL